MSKTAIYKHGWHDSLERQEIWVDKISINGITCTFQTKEIREHIERLHNKNEKFRLPEEYTYELLPSDFHGQVAKIIAKEQQQSKIDKAIQGLREAEILQQQSTSISNNYIISNNTLNQSIQALHQAEKEKEAWEDNSNDWQNQAQEQEKQLQLYKEYLTHKKGCLRYSKKWKCTCGFEQLLKDAEAH